MKDINYWDIIINQIKLLCRRKKILLFSLVLPLLMMGIINITMTALPSEEEVSGIKLGLVTEYRKELPYSFLNAKEFQITYGSIEEMQTLLRERKIDAYIIVGNETKLYLNDMGRKQAIIRGYLESEIQRFTSTSSSHYDIKESDSNLVINITDRVALPDKKSLAFLYITTLLCILGARWGFEEMKELIPGYSGIGKKLSIGSVSRWKILLLNLACIYILQTACIMSFSVIMIKAILGPLQIRTDLYLVTVALGSLSGILTGALFSNIKRVNLKMKDILLNLLLITMIIAAFFTPAATRYFLNFKLPYLKFVNPPALITEMLYCITLQEGANVFIKDGLLLLLYILTMGICLLFLHRRWED